MVCLTKTEKQLVGFCQVFAEGFEIKKKLHIPKLVCVSQSHQNDLPPQSSCNRFSHQCEQIHFKGINGLERLKMCRLFLYVKPLLSGEILP